MADDFVDVPKDDFVPVNTTAAPISGSDKPIEGPVANVIFSRGKLAALSKAFGTGWTEGFGPDPVGLSPETSKEMANYGLLYDRKVGGPPTVLSSFGEAFLRPAFGAIGTALRAMSGAARAVGDTALEAGVPRDIVAMPGMWQGGPLGLGKVSFRPGLGKDVRAGIPVEEAGPEKIARAAIRTPDGEVVTATTHGEALEMVAKKTGQTTDAVVDSLGKDNDGFLTNTGRYVTREEALDVAKKADQFHEDPKMKEAGFDPKALASEDMKTSAMQEIRENVKNEPLPREFMDTRGSGRQFHGTQREIFELDPYQSSSLNYYGSGLYTTDAVDIAHGYTKRKGREGEGSIHEVVPNRDVKTFDMEAPVPEWLTKDLGKGELDGYVKDIAEGHFDGVPENTRELYDQIRENSRGEGYSADTVQEIFDMLRSAMESQGFEAMTHTGGLRTKNTPHKVVIHFDPSEYKVAPIDRGAFAKPLVTDLDAAAELGVIGDAKPTAFEMPREQPKVMAAERAPEGDLVRRSDVIDNPAVDKAGNIRLDLIETSDDAAKVIRAAAEANDGYMPARQGEISLTHQEQLSQVLGVPVSELDLKGIGRRLQNDADLRVSIQGMVQSAENVTQLAKDAHLSNDPKDLIKFQEAWMRHDILQETVSGLTAEWGRTGNVFQEFRERVKDTRQLGEFLKEKRGRSVEDLRDLAGKIASLDPSQVPSLMANARRQNFWDKLHYYWVNSILSGQFSQATYLISDAMFAVYDNVAIKPVAGVVGAIRGGDVPRAFIGEGAAGLYGYISGVPEGLKAAWEVLRTGERSILPREISTGKNPVTEQRPIGGYIGTTVGLPSRELSMIHAVQSNMAYRSQLTSLAYREAAKSGHAPWSAEFRQELKGKLQFPTEAMMDEAVTYSQRMTFTDPITGAQKAVKDFAKNVPGMRYLIPFTTVPMNTLNAAIEGTPLSFLNDKMRSNLKGENGKVAQDTQIARLAAGSAVMGMASYWAMNGDITGNGPVNPEDRAIWLLTHAPNSVRIGDTWASFEKFAPLGIIFGMAADLVEAGKSGVDDKEWGQAAGHLAVAASNMLLNNTGMKGLSDLSEAVRAKDVEKALTKYSYNFAASFSPFSSGTGQIASMMDPNIREVKTLLDAFKNKMPKLREDLFPVRDWSGIPRANTRAEWGALFKSEHVNKDPIDLEMSELNIKMDKVKQYIGEVKLTPAQYDAYQNLAGVTTRTMLNSLVQQDGWYQVPAFAREEAMRKVIASARKYAASAVQAQSVGTADDIVRQGVQLKLDALAK